MNYQQKIDELKQKLAVLEPECQSAYNHFSIQRTEHELRLNELRADWWQRQQIVDSLKETLKALETVQAMEEKA